MQCALEGCDVEIEQPEKGPRRKFCCPAHRTAARSARLRAGAPLEAAAGQEAVPATVAPEAEERDQQPDDVELPAPRGSDDEPPIPASASTAPDGEAAEEPPIGDEPIGDEPIGEEPVVGAPAVAPPVAARAAEPGPASDDRALPSDAVASLPGRVVVRRDDAPPALRRQPVPLRAVRKPFPIRGRAVVAAGLVVAMALGGGASVIGGVDDAPTGSVEAQSLPPAGARWATDARVALVSIGRQIDDARAAEARWSATVGERANQPREVAVLAERRMALERTRMVLESQLSAWQNLQSSNAALGLAERQLQDFQAALQGPTTSAGRASTGQLEQQRLRLQGQVDRLRQQVASWDQDVQVAMTSPAPNPADVTTPLSRQVDDLIDQRRQGLPDGQGSTPGTPGTGDPATLSREPSSGDPAIDLPGTSEPPERGRDAALAGAARSAGGTVESAGDTVGGVVEAAGDATGGVVESAGDATGGVVESAGDAVGDVADTAGTLLSGGGDAPVERSAGDDEGRERRGSGGRGVLGLLGSSDGPAPSGPQDAGPDRSREGAEDSPSDPAAGLAATPVSLLGALGGGSGSRTEGAERSEQPGSSSGSAAEETEPADRPAATAAAALRDAITAGRGSAQDGRASSQGGSEDRPAQEGGDSDAPDSGAGDAATSRAAVERAGEAAGPLVRAALETANRRSGSSADRSGGSDGEEAEAAAERSGEARSTARATGERAREQAQRAAEGIRERLSRSSGGARERSASASGDADDSGSRSSSIRRAVSEALSRSSSRGSTGDGSSSSSSDGDSSRSSSSKRSSSRNSTSSSSSSGSDSSDGDSSRSSSSKRSSSRNSTSSSSSSGSDSSRSSSSKRSSSRNSSSGSSSSGSDSSDGDSSRSSSSKRSSSRNSSSGSSSSGSDSSGSDSSGSDSSGSSSSGSSSSGSSD